MMRTGIGRVSCCVYCKHEMGNLVVSLVRSKWSLCIINSQAELLNNNIMTWIVSILTWWVVLPPTLLTTLSRKWENQSEYFRKSLRQSNVLLLESKQFTIQMKLIPNFPMFQKTFFFTKLWTKVFTQPCCSCIKGVRD